MKGAEVPKAAGILRAGALLLFCLFVFTSTFSIAASQIALGISFVLWAALCAADRSALPGRLPIAMPFTLFTLVSIISALLSSDPAAAIMNLRNYLLFAAVWLTASLAADSRIRRRILWVLMVSGAGSALFGVVLYLLDMGRGSMKRTPGAFSNEMTFAGIMMLLLSLYAAVSIERGIPRRMRTMSIIASVSASFALLLTQTRSSWLAMFVSAIVILIVLRRRWIPIYIVAVAAALLLAPDSYRERIATIWDPQYRTNVQRINMVRGGISIYREHWIIGTGPVDLGEIYREHKPPEAVHIHGHMHNIFIHVAATLGTLGLIAFVFLLASMFRSIGGTLRLDLPPPDRAVAAGSLGAMSGFVVNGLFEWNFGDAEVLTIMLIIVGISGAVREGMRRQSRGPSPPAGAV
jgi:putative inorganic carbon (HCO3(-)) transporter